MTSAHSAKDYPTMSKIILRTSTDEQLAAYFQELRDQILANARANRLDLNQSLETALYSAYDELLRRGYQWDADLPGFYKITKNG